MPVLQDLLSGIDRAKRSMGRTISDLVENPSQVLEMMDDRAKNYNQNVQPTIQGGQLSNRPLTEQEVMDKHTQMAMDMQPGAIGTTMYRGLRRPYDPNHPVNIEWWSEGEDLAKRYGGNVMTRDVVPQSPLDLGFRTYGTEVKFEDVLGRIRRGIEDQYAAGKIDKSVAKELFAKSHKIPRTDEYKEVHEWLMNSPDAVDLMKGAGYDSLKHVEDGTQTYGLLKGSRPLNDLLDVRKDR